MRLFYNYTFYLVLVLPITVSAQPSFTMNGSAELISEACYRITSHKNPYDVGSIWAEYPTQLNHNFDIRFAVNFGCKKLGEGIAFVMHTDNEKYSAIGCSGQALGFANIKGCSNYISPSLAVELDTKYSAGMGDLYSPHITLIQNGNFLNPLHKAVRINSNGHDIRDCEYHSVRITWSPSKEIFQVFFDDELRISYKGDITSIFGKEKNIYFGFTGSTGVEAEMQMLCIQSIDVTIDENYESKRNFEYAVGIFPNPMNERLTVDVDFNDEQKIHIQIFNINGKLVYDIPRHKVTHNRYFFSMPGLPSGVYYVTVSNGKNRVSKKLVHVATIRA